MASYDGDSTANTNPARYPLSFFRNRFSNASLLSLSSVKSLLPQYSVVDTLEEPRANAHSDVSTDHRESLSGSSPTSAFPPSGGATEPPRYSLIHPRRSLVLTRRASTATRFDVEGDPQAHEFRYSYPIRPKNPWATLHLHTRDAVPGNLKPLQNQPRVPRFWSCDPITGTLQLDLDSPQNIQQINIMLTGSVILASHSRGTLQFLGHEFTLWDRSMGDPFQSDITDSKSVQKKKFDGRLAPGQYTFPFSFPFPTHADPTTKSTVLNISSISPFPPSPYAVGTTVTPPTAPLYDYGANNAEKAQRKGRFTSSAESPNETPTPSTRVQTPGHSRTSNLGSESHHTFASPIPQTFMEKDINPNVAYNVSVRITHGRFKASSKIKTIIAYIPASEPLPASQKRREAYDTGALLPCPMDDPEGWFALPTATIHGAVRINENLLLARVDCTLYMAQPLSYTRGSVIPCFITIYSDGVEVVHLLSSTETPTVMLLRRVRHPMTEYEQPGPVEPSYGGNPTNSNWAHTIVPTSDMTVVTHEVGRAKWWIHSKDVAQDPNVRHMEGEIHLNPDLQPSCDFQLFQVEYAVELLSFQSTSFKPDIDPPSPGRLRKGDNVIASNPVEIATLYRLDEPVPTPYSEPPKTYKVRSPDKNAVIHEEDQ